MVLVVQGTSPYKTLNDLIAAARAKPGALSLGAAPASSLHVAFEVIKRSADINMTFVPFPGTAPAINTLMGGHVTAVFADYPTVVGQLKSGTLRALVTASAKRDRGAAGRADASPRPASPNTTPTSSTASSRRRRRRRKRSSSCPAGSARR